MTAEMYAFISAIACGMLSVILWNITEALRNTIRAKAVINGVMDALWWVVTAVVFSICMWEITSLKIRAFEFIGVGIGAIVCHITLARPIRYVCGKIFGFFFKIIQFIFKILLTPWTFLYKILVVEKLRKPHLKLRKVAQNDSPEKQGY